MILTSHEWLPKQVYKSRLRIDNTKSTHTSFEFCEVDPLVLTALWTGHVQCSLGCGQYRLYCVDLIRHEEEANLR
jgi:hypothetical protein